MIWQKIKEEKFVLLWLALLGMLRAMHEISKFRPDWSWLPQWDYPFGIMIPPLDSYHVYGGLFILFVILGFRLVLRGKVTGVGEQMKIINVPTNKLWIWIIIVIVEMYGSLFFVFDLFYHGLFMKPEFMQWDYVIPFYNTFF